MEKQEANKLIAEKLDEVYALIAECESIADENDVGFSFDVSYGMGGYYSDGSWMSSTESCS